MKTEEEFKQFYNLDLVAVLSDLELDRKRGIKLTGFLFMCVLGAIILCSTCTSIISNGNILSGVIAVIVLSTIALVIILTIKLYRLRKSIKTSYKQRVIKEMIAFVDPHLQYTPKGRISETVFNASKIFLKDPNQYSGDDLVQGTIGKTDVSFSELNAIRVNRSKKNNQSEQIFKGIFFIADFHKNFIGETFVLPDTAEKMFGKFGTFLQKMNVSRPKLVKLENPEFERTFAVYGTDQVEARYILTPALMERIMDFKRKSGNVHLSFLHSKVYIAIEVNKNLFEPPFFKSMLDYSLISEYFSYLILTVNIVEDLDLNTRIWSKE